LILIYLPLMEGRPFSNSNYHCTSPSLPVILSPSLRVILSVAKNLMALLATTTPVIARRCEERSKQPKQSLQAIVRLLRFACSERHEILRYAQNDTKRRARNDSLSFYTAYKLENRERSNRSMGNVRVWLFRGLVAIAAGLMLASWFMPWWSCDIEALFVKDAAIIHPYGLEIERSVSGYL